MGLGRPLDSVPVVWPHADSWRNPAPQWARLPVSISLDRPRAQHQDPHPELVGNRLEPADLRP